MRKAGINLLAIGALVTVAAFLSQSEALGYVAFGCILVGAFLIVLRPVLPKLNGKHAPFIQPGTVSTGSQHPGRADNKDRRSGNPRFN